MAQTISAITRNFINLIYPLHCAGCGISLDPMDEFGICGSCLRDIRRNPKPHCGKCGRSVEAAGLLCPECRRTKFHFDRAHSAYLYEGALKAIIGQFKYKRKISLAKILSKLMIEFAADNIAMLDGIDVVTFVPIQNRRLRKRGFNQSEVLASNLSKEFDIPLIDALKKTRSTKPQNELTRDDRLVNLIGSFRAHLDSIRDREILLVDDVMTTGATLNECAKALLNFSAKSVKCLTLARGV